MIWSVPVLTSLVPRLHPQLVEPCTLELGYGFITTKIDKTIIIMLYIIKIICLVSNMNRKLIVGNRLYK